MKQSVARRGRVEQWTRERIERLPAPEIVQLRANAERLDEPDLAALCSNVIASDARARAGGAARENRATRPSGSSRSR